MSDNVNDDIVCPACGKTMKKVFIPSKEIYIDVCTDGCGGLYFDNRELSYVNKKEDDILPLEELLEGKNFKEVCESDIRVCPVCGTNMVKNYYKGSEIQIDECYCCGGIFLDNLELFKIRQELFNVVKKKKLNYGIENYKNQLMMNNEITNDYYIEDNQNFNTELNEIEFAPENNSSLINSPQNPINIKTIIDYLTYNSKSINSVTDFFSMLSNSIKLYRKNRIH